MNIRTFVAATMTALVMSGAAFAATMTPGEKCTALEKQFDQEIVKHASATKAASARTLRTEGSQMCQNGKAADGVKKLEQALNDIGVKPTY